MNPKIIVALLIITAACTGHRPPDAWIRIRPGSTVDRLVFDISQSPRSDAPGDIGHFRVDHCAALRGDGRADREDEPVWLVNPGPRRPTSLTVLEYGQEEEGWETLVPPARLLPGCYWITNLTANEIGFIVHESGAVTEILYEEALRIANSQ